MRFGFGVTAISRLSDELEVVLLPELTTGETSTREISRSSACGCNIGSQCDVVVNTF